MTRAASQAGGILLAGRYELLREIATGGMAEVWLARARSIGDFERRVAIKCCHPHLRKDADFVAMFLDEARLAAKIHHPNVVATLDVVDDPQALFLVMDYVEGATLQDLVRDAFARDARVPPDVSLRIGIDALNGLHAAHVLADERGRPLKIVHRDVSPHNVLVGADGVARISDFGVAKAEARATTTREGQVKGKLGYMAPEQLSGRELGPRADVFSMGVVLWEALVGARLFRGDTDADTATMILHRAIDPPSSRVPELPKALDDLVMRALERDPDRRFESAATMAEALESSGVPVASARKVGAYVRGVRGATEHAGEPTHATRPTVAEVVASSGAAAPPLERASPRRVVVAVVLGALALGGVAVAYWSSRGHAPADAAAAPSRVVEPPSAQSPSPSSWIAQASGSASVQPAPAASAPPPLPHASASAKVARPAPIAGAIKAKPTPSTAAPPAAPTGSEYHPSSL